MFQFFPPKFSMSHLISIGIKLTIEMSMKKKRKLIIIVKRGENKKHLFIIFLNSKILVTIRELIQCVILCVCAHPP